MLDSVLFILPMESLTNTQDSGMLLITGSSYSLSIFLCFRDGFLLLLSSYGHL
jgi:hypothetical protein